MKTAHAAAGFIGLNLSPVIALLLSTVGSLALAQAGPTPINNKPLTVCEILEHRQEYSGKIVKVRDEFYGGWMAGKNCAPFRSGGETYPPMIVVTSPCKPERADIYVAYCGNADWKVDEEALRRAYDEAWRLMAPEKPVVVEHPVYTTSERPAYATVIGRLDTKPLDRLGGGFGEQGGLPARLVLVSVDAVSRRR